jgi:hypothetical protein
VNRKFGVSWRDKLTEWAMVWFDADPLGLGEHKVPQARERRPYSFHVMHRRCSRMAEGRDRRGANRKNVRYLLSATVPLGEAADR